MKVMKFCAVMLLTIAGCHTRPDSTTRFPYEQRNAQQIRTAKKELHGTARQRHPTTRNLEISITEKGKGEAQRHLSERLTHDLQMNPNLGDVANQLEKPGKQGDVQAQYGLAEVEAATYEPTRTGHTASGLSEATQVLRPANTESTDLTQNTGDTYSYGRTVVHSFVCADQNGAEPVIVDENRGIMWTAEVSPRMMTWQEALAYCGNLEYGRYSDWRLPTKDELSSIVNPDLLDSSSDTNVVPLYGPFSNPSEGYLFSGNSVSGYKDAPWIMNLRNGHIFNGEGYNAYVRAVRNIRFRKADQPVSDIAECSMPSVVQIVVYDITGAQSAQGSGFFIAPGKILTNAHVIEDAYSSEVLSDIEYYDQVTVLKSDEYVDLALISVDDRGEPSLPLEEQQDIRPGKRIIAIGNPMGLKQTVSDGLVSGVRGIPGEIQLVQISAPISPGSSGGPLLNEDGRVIGVASAALAEGQNLNFAIGIETIKDFLSKPDDPQQLRPARSRVLWRVVLKWTITIVLGLIALAFGGGWWVIFIVIMLLMFLFYLLKGLWGLMKAPFRRKAKAESLVVDEKPDTPTSEDMYTGQVSLFAQEDDDTEGDTDKNDPFYFQCWKCGELLEVDKSTGENSVECDGCGTKLEIPTE